MPTTEERNKHTSLSTNGQEVLKLAPFDLGQHINQSAKETHQQPDPAQTDAVDYAAILEQVSVSLTADIGKPPVCITVETEEGVSILGTLGNLSVVIGKAKSRKTFFVGAVVAALLQSSCVLNRVKGQLSPRQNLILYFDTEQSSYHLQRSLKRICALAGIENPPNLRGYGLRSKPTALRRELIEWAIYNTSGVAVVVIDGIRDCVFDINSPEEATDTATRLLRWTDEKQVHVLTVLHQNKGDQNARGHLGTELVNKAETVLSVARNAEDKAISIVTAEYCRDKDFEPFSFTIDEQGLPCFVDELSPELKLSKSGRAGKKNELTPEDIDVILSRAFAKDRHLGNNELHGALRSACQFLGKPQAKNAIEDLMSLKYHDGTLGKEKVAGKGHNKYFLTANKNLPNLPETLS